MSDEYQRWRQEALARLERRDYRKEALARIRRERVFVFVWFATLGMACWAFPPMIPVWLLMWIVGGAGYLGNLVR